MHPPYLFSLNKKHGEYINPGGSSSASEAIALGTHVGTHIDALCHFSSRGKLHGGEPVEKIQDYTTGLERFTIDTVEPIFRRGVLIDVPKMQGVDALPLDFVITPQHLERSGVKVEAGDVVLLRTGWAQYWDEPARFISQVKSPGPGLDAARWLSERKIFAAGSDTAPFEAMPNPSMSVHVHLLVESGIHIMECLNMEELSRSGVTEFLFVYGSAENSRATGSPIRPVALVSKSDEHA